MDALFQSGISGTSPISLTLKVSKVRDNRVFRQVVQFQEHRTVAALQLAVKLHHHLTAPVIAFNEALASVICGVATERPGHRYAFRQSL